MYDRKTWFVVAACVVLLFVNIYFTSKNATERQKLEQQQAAEQAAKAPAADASATPGADPAKGDLEVPTPQPLQAEVLVTLSTPQVTYTFTSFGGGLKTAEIAGQQGVLGPVQINRHGTRAIGTLAAGADNFEGAPYEYVQGESVEGKKVVFRGKLDSGLVVTKTWSLVESGTGSGYQLDFVIDTKNTATGPTSLGAYSLFLGAAAPVGLNERGDGTQLIYHDGGAFETVPANSFSGGWFGMSPAKTQQNKTAEKLEYAGVADQFFASVVHPVETYKSTLWSKVSDLTLKADAKPVKIIYSGMSLPEVTVPAGESRSYAFRLFSGPKENHVLQKMEDEQKVPWASIMNYGLWSPFSRFMNRALITVHGWVEGFTGKASWGIAVILLTIVIRTAIWPLYNRSNRTAKRMAKLKPEMDALREKYPDDQAKVSQETMALYRKYGINPLGSCLPMFAQLPIFMGFFSMLNHAVEMRGHGFLWIKDLAEPDTFWHIGNFPINILPILMGITSMIQMAMMPNTSADKTQATMMKLMPLMFLYICYSSPAALALYWTTSNLFSITQTWLSNRMPEPELKPAKVKAGKSWMERMAENAEQAQKERMRKANGRVVEPDEKPKKRPPRTGG